MCESSLGVIISPGLSVFSNASLVDRMKAILKLIPHAAETRVLISHTARSMIVTRGFWIEVLGYDYNWEFVIDRSCMKKFFKEFNLESFYLRKQRDDFKFFLVCYEDLINCTSVEALQGMCGKEPDLCDKLPEIVNHNIARIDEHITRCKAAIMPELLGLEMVSPTLVDFLEQTFKDLRTYYLQKTSCLF